MRLDSLWQDVRYAARSFAKAPTFTAVVLVTLALGIGASTAIFSLVNGILLRPLPYPEPDRLVYLNEVRPDGSQMSVSWPNFVDWRARQHSFEALALSRTESLTLTGVDHPERLRGRRVTGNFFDVIGVGARIGRVFGEAEDRADSPGHGRRQPRLLAERPRRRPGCARTRDRARRDELHRHRRAAGRLSISRPRLRRLRAGRAVDREQPVPARSRQPHGLLRRRPAEGRASRSTRRRAEIEAIGASLQREYPKTNTNVNVKATPLADSARLRASASRCSCSSARSAACSSSPASTWPTCSSRAARPRQHELSVRAALGGGRRRLVGQLLVESSLVSIAGGALGLLVGSGLLRLLIAVAPDGTPRLDEVALDGRAVALRARRLDPVRPRLRRVSRRSRPRARAASRRSCARAPPARPRARTACGGG